MAKTALNMLTRTTATEMFDHGFLVTSIDTGWITDERPHTTKQRLATEGFCAPLDLADGAARVYEPIVQRRKWSRSIWMLSERLQTSSLVATGLS